MIRHRTQETLDTGHRTQVKMRRHRTQDTDHRTKDTGLRTQVKMRRQNSFEGNVQVVNS